MAGKINKITGINFRIKTPHGVIKQRYKASPEGYLANVSNPTIRAEIKNGHFAVFGGGIPLMGGNKRKTELCLYHFTSEVPKGRHVKEIEGYSGKLEIWKYYSDFSSLKASWKTQIQFSKMLDIFGAIEGIFRTMKAEEPDVNKHTDYDGFLMLAGEFKKKMINYISKREGYPDIDRNLSEEEKVKFANQLYEKLSKQKITVEEIDRMFASESLPYILDEKGKKAVKSSLSMEQVSKEFFASVLRNPDHPVKDTFVRLFDTIQMVVNYIVKGINNMPLENSITNFDEKLILLAPNVTPREAKMIPKNVDLVMATEMPESSHAEIWLAQNGVKFFKPRGTIADILAKDSKIKIEKGAHATVTINKNNMAMYVGLPEDLLAFHKEIEGKAETQHKLDQAYSGLERRPLGGERVNLRVDISDAVKATEEYSSYAPDGIGLVRTEFIRDKFTEYASAKKIASEMIRLCDAATESIGDVRSPQPVVVRFTDVSETGASGGKRRDTKLPIGFVPNGLSGAKYLLSPEGLPHLKEEMKAAIFAEVARPDQIRLMLPFVTDVAQIKKVKEIFEEVKKKTLPEIRNYTVGNVKVYRKVKLEDINIRIGSMIESNDAVSTAMQIIQESDFVSIGLNDLRNSFNKQSIANIEMVSALSHIVKSKTNLASNLSVCGQIKGTEELIVLLALGIKSITLPFKEIPNASLIIRALDRDTLEKAKRMILSAKTDEELNEIIEKVKDKIGSKNNSEISKLAAATRTQVWQGEQMRFKKIHAFKVKLIDEIRAIISGNEKDKHEKIYEKLMAAFSSKGLADHEKTGLKKLQDLVDIPPASLIKEWITDEMQIVAFFDEWEIRQALNIKSRCTPYIFYYSKQDDMYWARAIPRGGDTGTKSRYFISELKMSGKSNQQTLPGLSTLQMNYFDENEKTVKTIGCNPEIVAGHPDRFNVTVPGENGANETVQLLRRVENGKVYYYRLLAREKLFAAQALLNPKSTKIPEHASIFRSMEPKRKEEGGGVSVNPLVDALYITNRKRFAEIDGLRIPNIERSVLRDSSNSYYDPIDKTIDGAFVANQIMYIKMNSLGELPQDCAYVVAVDNWKQNSRDGVNPLLSNPTDLVGRVRFLAAEIESDEVRLSYVKDIKGLQQKLRTAEDQFKALLKEAQKLGMDTTQFEPKAKLQPKSFD